MADARRSAGTAALTLAALGVVFGDIGTSPLYALHAVFTIDNHAVKPTQDAVYGVISLVVWSITIIVSLKYVTLIMRADNEGEGGIMALIALVQRALRGSRGRVALIALGLVGASLFYGDGMITPAISVLSAVEGLSVAAPALDSLVVPVALVVLTLLFAIQRFGTGTVGRLFGPVMGVWFALLAIAGLGRVVADPEILKALSPTYGIQFIGEHGGTAFVALGAVVLAVTGAEALYADMGHFGRPPIRRAWFLFVFPALTLNYMGQGSLILHSPKAIENPFFLLFPHWARIPMVVVATAAAVIASQAVISGAFSVTRQAVRLGFLPRLNVRQTSEHEAGQVYLPAINTVLFVAVVALVVGFGSSEALAAAYGIAVTGTLAIDTILFFVVVRVLWRRPLWMVVVGCIAFLVVDLGFFSANLPKVVHGGWFPLAIAVIVYTLLSTWHRGREIVTERREEAEGPLRDFVEEVRAREKPLYRPERTGVFLSAGKETTPLALRANVDHNHTLHQCVVIVSLSTERVPHVAPADRLTIDELGYEDDGIMLVSARFGFLDDTDVPATLRLAAENDLERPIDLTHASYFLSHMTIVRSASAPGMVRWREKLFIAMSRVASSPVPYFRLPDDRIVTMGGHIEL